MNCCLVQFQVRPQEDPDKHDSSAKCTRHHVSPSEVLRAVRVRSTRHGLRLSVRGVRSLRAVRGAGRRQVGDHRWSVQLLPAAAGVSNSDFALSADAELEGFATSAVDSWMLSCALMVRCFYER